MTIRVTARTDGQQTEFIKHFSTMFESIKKMFNYFVIHSRVTIKKN